MQRNFFLLFLLTTTIFTSLYSKNNLTIYGKIIEKENGRPLSFATVVIQTADNAILSGTISGQDGSFSLINSTDGECRVKISFIGFRDTTLKIEPSANKSTIDLGNIALSEDIVALKSAVVSVRVPVIEQKLDKIIMNVAEAVSTHGSSALDILKKAPGVSVDPSGEILLNGSQVQVWLDGRPSNISGSDLEALLSGTDGSTIDKIEIIAHPSSKYDAQGSGGIINIRTKRNFVKGVNGSLKGSYTGASYDKYYHASDATFLINHRSEKKSMSFSYNPRYIQGFNSFQTITDMGTGNIVNSKTFLLRNNSGHNLKLSNDWFLNKKNILGFVVSGSFRDLTDSSDVDTGSEYFQNGNLVQKASTKIINELSFDNLYANINYTHYFKENQEITLNGDYSLFNMNRDSRQGSYFTDPAGNESKVPDIFNTTSAQSIKIASFKADYEQSINNNAKLEAGFKWAQSRTDNNLVRRDFKDAIWVPNINQSTVFLYKENISAAYITLSKQFNPKLSIKGGIRAELTQSKGDWISSDTVTTKNYLDLFPSIFIGYNPNKKVRWSASYTLRIQRPNFEQLNPQRFYIDATSSALGNPDIDPQYSHQLSLSLGLSQYLNFGINGQFRNKTIVQTPSLDSESGDKLLKWDNFGQLKMLGVNASVTEYPVAKWLVMNGNISLSYINSYNSTYSKEIIFTQGNIGATVILPKDTKIEFTGYYQSGVPYGYFNLKPKSDYTLGVKKGVLENKGVISILATDIFGTNYNRISLTDNVFKNYEFVQRNKSKQIIVTFTYRFGQSKSQKQRKVGNLDETSRVNSGN
ncbi:MAG TPA: hypothetical protein DEO54_07280 [Rikenellaceae bacterium]|nr:MAG: hypothetical protein A2X20_07780 [Bacteroidetes bacterium GWE2_40_15]HBZ26025.1 hypothetical protein [Rikenellaceae bacterium]